MKNPLRLLQAFTVFSAGLYGLFVLMGNLMDYDSNYQFVKHVLSMDTTFEGNALMWRAITAPWLWTVAYIGIILAEAAFAALGLIGGVKLFLRRNASAELFDRARGWGYGAYAMGLAIWFLGFIVIGSEWFAMWQSSTWNGKDTAMPLAILWAAFAVLLALGDRSQERAEVK
ncbi:MAG: hypothetical protein CMH34_07510 [Microbacterium sp.]|nr:hypothetical protein [Microbacterium sp.]|tara:strand:- start:494 stop:1009 length:516 start_codon:yes stop_codon:yes gene_type:complete